MNELDEKKTKEIEEELLFEAFTQAGECGDASTEFAWDAQVAVIDEKEN
jgi:hypothetical protein